MKKIFITLSLTLLTITGTIAQQTMQLTFTAIDSTYYTQLDSIKVMNRTKECDTMLYWNDTVLVLDVNVGLQEQEVNEKFQVKAYPNPVLDEASLKVVIPEEGKVDVIISSIHGRLIQAKSYHLSPGMHEFSFIPGGEAMYFISFSWQGHKRYLKLINAAPEKGRESFLSYVGGNDQIEEMKSSARSDFFEFALGDQLQYIGYTDTLESGIFDVPLESEIYTFQFAYNIPCIGTPIVEYTGQVYNTVQIFSQCWLKENLNVGIMIDSLQEMQDNGVIEKYCFRNSLDSCEKYGGYYQWDEMVQYIYEPATKGICPPGWHLPDENEWCNLTTIIDPAVDCEEVGVTGIEAGYKMKTMSGWHSNGNGVNTYGFSALPSGCRNGGNWFNNLGQLTYFWSSSEGPTGFWAWSLMYSQDVVRHYYYHELNAFSVRCVKD